MSHERLKIMNTFAIILTIFAAPVDVAANAPLTLQPMTTIEFVGTTENAVTRDCARVAKALMASKMQAYCSDVVDNSPAE